MTDRASPAATAEPAPGGTSWRLSAGRLLRTHGLSVILLALGLAGAGLLVLSDRIRERLLFADLNRIHALGEIEAGIATAHLWIEEYVTGDEVHLGEIDERLERASVLSAALLGDGDSGSEGDYEVAALEEPALMRRAAELAAGIEEFADVLRRRQEGYAAGEDVGIGSPLDVEQDRAFQRLIAAAGVLDHAISNRVLANQRRSRTLFRVILVAWLAIVVTAVSGIAVRQRHRAVAEAALRDREEQLYRSRKMEAVGRLAGGIAHDINNYLSAITAQCERVRMGAEEEDPVARRMDRVIETAFRASQLIKQLLAFTRRQPLRLRVLHLNRVVGGLAPMMRRLLGEDIRLETGLAPGLWTVEADPSQLEQVIVNLLVNAREAMPQGGRVVVTTANRPGQGDDGAGDRVELAIADDGPGVPPEIRDKLFEPFFTTREAQGGSGLGLATVYGIVTGAGGTVGVESEEGEGTRFVIRLPRSVGEEVAEPVPEDEVDRPVGGHERILLVDDNEAFRASIRESLAALGYTVVEAADGESAITAYGDGAGVDLVVSDLRMPGMSGPAAVDRMRKLRPDLKILFISGSSGSSVLQQGFKRGEFDILNKPFTVAELDRRIRSQLDGGRSEGILGPAFAEGAGPGA